MSNPDTDRQFVGALARGLSVLEVMSRAGHPLSNGDLARLTKLAPSTVSRLVHTLTALGYTRMSSGQRAYELTAKSLSLGYPVLAGMTLILRLRPYLRALSETTGETTALAIPDRLHISFVDVQMGAGQVAVRLVPGGRMPLAQSAAGIAMLAAMPEREQRSLAARARGFLGRRGGDVATFNRALDEARESGIAITHGAWRTGIGGVAAAIRHHDGIAAISIPVATGNVSAAAMRGPLATALRDTIARLETMPPPPVAERAPTR